MKKIIIVVALSILFTSVSFLSNESAKSTAFYQDNNDDMVYPLSNRILPGA